MTSIKRFELSEISLKRFASAGIRRIANIPHYLAWHLNSADVIENSQRLQNFSSKHTGERCFTIGNGPSLNQMDLSMLKKEITFGMNRIYLNFETMDFVPTYYVAINGLVLKQFGEEIDQLNLPKFLNWNYRHIFKRSDPNINYLKTKFTVADKFETDVTNPIYSGGTVTFAAMQIAYFMGFQEVYLIGIDHSFADKGTPNATETRVSNRDDNHFHPGYFPKGTKWQLPDLKRSERAYELAQTAFLQDGRSVIDATLNGKCQVFPKMDFDSLF
jgi:hypothetical protein